ncbi:MAG: hypothetical protein J7500_12090 [Sphingomonas sp.]|uniref:hypothetical protein n=1 Tax=Sphingomonas sp. TaxID=28214 RepID=UPI001B144F64|nr:hypothetical protein [Sphingomonas sp.]MBO9623441.1 hypothetical protein [Sphingomonas sp.]
MAPAREPPPETDPVGARERLAVALREALYGTEDAPLEEETQRLMLHLAIEPYERPLLAEAPSVKAPRRRRSLLRRLLRRTAPHARA